MRNNQTKIAPLLTVVALLFFPANTSAAFRASVFLDNVKISADRVAMATEQAQRMSICGDTARIYLYLDDFLEINKFSGRADSENALGKDPEKSVILEEITMQHVNIGKDASAATVLSMKFSNGRGSMLPQKVLVNLQNRQGDLTRPVIVKFVQGDSIKPQQLSLTSTGFAANGGVRRLDSVKNNPLAGDSSTKTDVRNEPGASWNTPAVNPQPIKDQNAVASFSGVLAPMNMPDGRNNQTPGCSGNFAHALGNPSGSGSSSFSGFGQHPQQSNSPAFSANRQPRFQSLNLPRPAQ